MATLRSGSKGTGVTDLQEKLKEAGFDPGPIDGIYGPKTVAAVKAYQKANDLEVDGIAGPLTLGKIGSGSPSTEGGGEKTDYTDDSLTRFNGLPGKPEIWKDSETGEIYVVYYAPGLEPPVPLLFDVPSEEVLKTYFGDKDIVFDREITSSELIKVGAIPFGDTGDLKDVEGNPWAGFTQKMERAKEVMPWLADDEVFSLIAGAYLEGRQLEDWELAQTEWYSSHTEAERKWLTKVVQDPATAKQEMASNKTKVYDMFSAMGIANPDASLVDYMANQYTFGTWDQTTLAEQLDIISGGGEGSIIDAGLADFMNEGSVENVQATGGRDDVMNMYAEWLGPAYMPSNTEIDKWAGILRDDPDGGRARLTEMLRSQRLALFPEYEDSTLTWANISGPWRSMAQSVWGVPIEDSDSFFQDIVRMNNAGEAEKMLRNEGFDRGYDQVVNQVIAGMKSGMGSNVRGTV